MEHDKRPATIRLLASNNDIGAAVPVIRAAFRTVAEQFNLTEDNCPSHPSFMTEERLRAELDSGLELYGLFQSDCLIGTIGLTQHEAKYSLERLAVLPEYRRQGYGRQLVEFVFQRVRVRGGQIVGLAVINEHHSLKAWYAQLGFIEVGVKQLPQRPFTVCFMEKAL